MSKFVSGRELSEQFYAEVVAPQLAGISHAAALLGWGSDVLGYDTTRSTDHGWGPRVQVITATPDVDLDLPDTFQGHPVRFGWDGREPRAWVEVGTLSNWLYGHLGVDATATFDTLDWLLTPQQKLLGVVSGAVFTDPDGQLAALRSRLAWYPDQIWRWLLACQWHRVANEEAFVARTAEVGDTTGSVVTANRLVRDMMRLALLQQRQYAPYQKWLGTAFARLPSHDNLRDDLAAAVRGDQNALGAAYLALAARHNRSGLTAPIPARLGDYHNRPARVVMVDQFSAALQTTVSDPFLRDQPLTGSIDQIIDNRHLRQPEAVPTPTGHLDLARRHARAGTVDLLVRRLGIICSDRSVGSICR